AAAHDLPVVAQVDTTGQGGVLGGIGRQRGTREQGGKEEGLGVHVGPVLAHGPDWTWRQATERLTPANLPVVTMTNDLGLEGAMTSGRPARAGGRAPKKAAMRPPLQAGHPYH